VLSHLAAVHFVGAANQFAFALARFVAALVDVSLEQPVAVLAEFAGHAAVFFAIALEHAVC